MTTFTKRLLTGFLLCAGSAAPALSQETLLGTWFHDCRADVETGRKICKASFRAPRSEQRPAAALHVVIWRKDQPIVVVNVTGVPRLTVAALRVDGMPAWSSEQCSGASCTFTRVAELVDDMSNASTVLVQFMPRGGAMHEVSVPLAGFRSALDAAEQDMMKE